MWWRCLSETPGIAVKSSGIPIARSISTVIRGSFPNSMPTFSSNTTAAVFQENVPLAITVGNHLSLVHLPASRTSAGHTSRCESGRTSNEHQNTRFRKQADRADAHNFTGAVLVMADTNWKSASCFFSKSTHSRTKSKFLFTLRNLQMTHQMSKKSEERPPDRPLPALKADDKSWQG